MVGILLIALSVAVFWSTTQGLDRRLVGEWVSTTDQPFPIRFDLLGICEWGDGIAPDGRPLYVNAYGWRVEGDQILMTNFADSRYGRIWDSIQLHMAYRNGKRDGHRMQIVEAGPNTIRLKVDEFDEKIVSFERLR